MKFVEICQLQNDGTQRIVATCRQEGKKIICQGDEVFVAHLLQSGIYDYAGSLKKKLFPKDGVRFLENLKFAFRSGYLNASEVKEG